MTLRWVDPPTIAADVAFARKGKRPYRARHPLLVSVPVILLYLAAVTALAFGLWALALTCWHHPVGASQAAFWLIIAPLSAYGADRFRIRLSTRSTKL